MSAATENYGLIGDCQTAALVGRDGSIDWLCWPRFDSDACFAARIGKPSNGRWLIAPSDDAIEVSRCYRRDTLVPETTFRTATGQVTVIDFMQPRGRSSDLIRVVRGHEGEMQMCMELVLSFGGYGATMPWVSRLKDGALRAVAGPDMVVLRTPVTLWGENFKTAAMFTVAAGETKPFVLSYGPSHLPPPEPVDCHSALAACEKFWRDWTATTKTDGPYADPVRRSLITLKAHVWTDGRAAADGVGSRLVAWLP
jgi:GH15 family glucan-1,4-alpha-glucosidase